MLSSNVVAITNGIPDGLVSLGIGLLGVALARWVFVNRETRTTGRKPAFTEALPLTLVAMLITGVLILDKKFSVSTSAFLGLGVGWTAVLLLDILGELVLSKFKAVFSSGPALPAVFPKKADLSGMDGLLTSYEVTADKPMGDLLVAAGKALDEDDKVHGVKDDGGSVETHEQDLTVSNLRSNLRTTPKEK